METATQTDTQATVERVSDRETAVRRSLNAPARLVWAAWTEAELFRRWWVPKSYGMTLLSCELDVRPGGSYRLVFKHPGSGEPMAFFGRYLEAVPHERIVWTNEESGPSGQITTVTMTEQDGTTLLEMRETYPTKDACDEAIASGATGGQDETFAQLDELLETLPATA